VLCSAGDLCQIVVGPRSPSPAPAEPPALIEQDEDDPYEEELCFSLLLTVDGQDHRQPPARVVDFATGMADDGEFEKPTNPVQSGRFCDHRPRGSDRTIGGMACCLPTPVEVHDKLFKPLQKAAGVVLERWQQLLLIFRGFEQCTRCARLQECAVNHCAESSIATCTSMKNQLLKWAPHSANIRTMLRSFYRLREKVLYLGALDSACQQGDYKAIRFLTDPANIPKPVDKRMQVSIDRDRKSPHCQEKVVEKWGAVMAEYAVAINKPTAHPCDICNRLFREEEVCCFVALFHLMFCCIC